MTRAGRLPGARGGAGAGSADEHAAALAVERVAAAAEEAAERKAAGVAEAERVRGLAFMPELLHNASPHRKNVSVLFCDVGTVWARAWWRARREATHITIAPRRPCACRSWSPTTWRPTSCGTACRP